MTKFHWGRGPKRRPAAEPIGMRGDPPPKGRPVRQRRSEIEEWAIEQRTAAADPSSPKDAPAPVAAEDSR